MGARSGELQEVTSIFGILCTPSTSKLLISFTVPTAHCLHSARSLAKRQLLDFFHCAVPLSYVLLRFLKSGLNLQGGADASFDVRIGRRKETALRPGVEETCDVG